MRKKKAPDYLTYRIFAVLGFFVLFFAAIFLRAFDLQVFDGERLRKMARSQHIKTLNIQPKRGDIFDRNLKELAVSVEVDSIYARPANIANPRATALTLAPMLSMGSSEVEKRLRAGKSFVWLKRQVELKDGDRARIAGIEGIGLTKESRRYYPNRHLAANLIGFTGLDSTGLEGIELYYDSILKGIAKNVTGERDAMGRVMLYEDMEKKAPGRGMEVELTVDKTIQYIAENALKKAVESYKAKGATALVMNPHTGEVLAMANYPNFDPNDISGAGPRLWRNKTITDAFEPGSILKLFLVSAALEENIVQPKNRIWCENGKYRVADRVFHDTKEHGWLTVEEVIKYSSNIGAAKIGEKLGIERLIKYLRAFGFGEKTGIDLPGEGRGSFGDYRRGSGVALCTISFGHGVSATNIQLVSALSAIANGGFLMKPYTVRSIKDPNGNTISENNPVIIRRVISKEAAAKMTDMLITVTHGGGTGGNAAIDGFQVAGKTGTAQKPDLKKGGYLEDGYISSFMGFVPARNPKLAILVTVDEPMGEHYGGAVAAPVFREIASEGLSYMGAFPDQPMPKGTDAPLTVKAATPPSPPYTRGGTGGSVNEDVLAEAAPVGPGVPDFTGKTVRAVLKMAQEKSIEVEIAGSGKAISQSLAPGRGNPSSARVKVFFR